MRCKECREELKEEWNYCPRCGNSVERWYDKLTYGLDDVMKQMIADIQNMIFKSVFKVDIKPLEIVPQQPNIKSPQNKALNSVDERYIRDVKDVVDAEANIVKGDYFAEVEMHVPGVESLDDVYVVINDQSAEIRAYTKNDEKMYFKVVEIPQGAELVDRVLKGNEKLIVRFEIPEEYEEE